MTLLLTKGLLYSNLQLLDFLLQELGDKLRRNNNNNNNKNQNGGGGGGNFAGGRRELAMRLLAQQAQQSAEERQQQHQQRVHAQARESREHQPLRKNEAIDDEDDMNDEDRDLNQLNLLKSGNFSGKPLRQAFC